MSYKILNSILLIPFLVVIESCMTPIPVGDRPTTPSGKLKDGSTHPEEPPPKVKVKFFYSPDGVTTKKLFDNGRLSSKDRIRIETIPQENAFIKILLVNNDIGKTQHLTQDEVRFAKVKANEPYSYPSQGFAPLDNERANETICVIAYKQNYSESKEEEENENNCEQDNVVGKVTYEHF